MSDCIDRNTKYVILCIVRLCKGHELYDEEHEDMENMGNIPFDLLVKTVYASLPDEDIEEWEKAVQNVSQELISNYISFEDKEKKMAWISGANGDFEKDKLNYFYTWSFFQYTYVLDKEDEESRRIFLWGTILLPYIHKVNKNSPEIVKNEIEKLLKEHPVVEGEESERKTLEILQEKYSGNLTGFKDEIFCNYAPGVVIDDMLSKSNIDNAFNEIESGWKCLLAEISE